MKRYSVSPLIAAAKTATPTRFWMQDQQSTSETACGKLLLCIHNWAIVLLHATSKINADILDDLLNW